MGIGGSAAIVPHRDRVMECMLTVKPAAITAVPLMLNRMYNGVQAGVAQVSPLKQSIVKMAFGIARRRNHLLEFHKVCLCVWGGGYSVCFVYSICDV